MRVLVTRPREDAVSLVAALEARGHDVLVEPLLTITLRQDVDWPPGHWDAQALLATSANGVRAFARVDGRRGLPVFAVGDASAAVARSLGFGEVVSAAGDVADLADRVIELLDPAAGPLLHPAASSLAGNLQASLGAAGFSVLRAVTYDAVPATALTDRCILAFDNGLIDAATFFSPRTAAAFARLIEAAGLSQACRRVVALCLSEAVEAQIAGLCWRRIAVAARPEQTALLAEFDAML
ncbi:MAG: uroporphyrinogen-III synthase [Kiloniellaceae bacterium]